MTEEQLVSYMVGFMMVQQCSMKKAKGLCGDTADVDVMRELNKINDFETYIKIKASDLP